MIAPRSYCPLSQKLVQAIVLALHDTVAPVLCTLENPFVRLLLTLKILNRKTYRLRIDAAHQFADQLTLPTQRASRFYS